jgi:hypothetical protein
MTGPENLFFNKERLNHRISSAKILLREIFRYLSAREKFCEYPAGKKYISCRKEVSF